MSQSRMQERVWEHLAAIRRNERLLGEWKAVDLRGAFSRKAKSQVRRMRNKYRRIIYRRTARLRRYCTELGIPALV